MPKFARVNYLKTKDVEWAVRQFKGAKRDEHLPYLFSVPADVKNLHEHPLVMSGQVILQDKSSCFPAHALAQLVKASSYYPCDVLDATAAPGNKVCFLLETPWSFSSFVALIIQLLLAIYQQTTQLVALLNKGKVYAMDRSPERFKLLTRRVAEVCLRE